MQQRGSLSIAWEREDEQRTKVSDLLTPEASEYEVYNEHERHYIQWLRSPSVVLGIEQEVGAHDGDTHGHDAEDDQDQHHEAVHIVNFVGPERCEDEVPEESGGRTSAAAKITSTPPPPSLYYSYTYISMKMDPNGRIPPRQTMTAGSINLRERKMWIWSAHIRLPPLERGHMTYCIVRWKKEKADTKGKFKKSLTMVCV